jgi:hypothetical protein
VLATAPSPGLSFASAPCSFFAIINLELSPELKIALVAAALRFRAAEPWRELANTDYLLIDESTRGLRALTILGNGGSQFGLHAYDATCIPEILFLLDEWNGTPPASPPRMLELLDGACLDLVPKAETEPHDRALLAAADYKPAWPVFRQFRPGAFPWRIDESAARRLLADLDRALRWAELAPRIDERAPDTPVALRHLPAVSPDLPVDRPWTPDDLRWIRLELPAPRPAEALPVAAPERAVLDALPRKPAEWWWIDERSQAARIQESPDQLPWFPRFGVCLDGRSGVAHPPGMGPATRPLGASAREALAQTVQACRWLPGQLRTPNRSLAEALRPWAEAAGVELRIQEKSEALEEFWGMLDLFHGA